MQRTSIASGSGEFFRLDHEEAIGLFEAGPELVEGLQPDLSLVGSACLDPGIAEALLLRGVIGSHEKVIAVSKAKRRACCALPPTFEVAEGAGV